MATPEFSNEAPSYTGNDLLDKLRSFYSFEFGDKFKDYTTTDLAWWAYNDISEEVTVPETSEQLLKAIDDQKQVFLSQGYRDSSGLYTLSQLVKATRLAFDPIKINIPDVSGDIETLCGKASVPVSPTKHLTTWLAGFMTGALTIASSRAFRNLSNLKMAVFSGAAAIGPNAFDYSLRVFEATKLRSFASTALYNCENLAYANIGLSGPMDFSADFVRLSQQLRFLRFTGKGQATFNYGIGNKNLSGLFLPNITSINEDISTDYSGVWAPRLVDVDFSSIDFSAENGGKLVTQLLAPIMYNKVSVNQSSELSLSEPDLTKRAVTLYAKNSTGQEILSSPYFPFSLPRGCQIVCSNVTLDIPQWIF